MQKEPTKKAAGKRNAGANPPRKLSRAEKKQIAEVIRQAILSIAPLQGRGLEVCSHKTI